MRKGLACLVLAASLAGCGSAPIVRPDDSTSKESGVEQALRYYRDASHVLSEIDEVYRVNVTADRELGVMDDMGDVVYQVGVPKEELEPVLLFTYMDRIPGEQERHEPSLCRALIFKTLADEFKGHLRFVAYNWNDRPDFNREEFDALTESAHAQGLPGAVPGFFLLHYIDRDRDMELEEIDFIDDHWVGGPNASFAVPDWTQFARDWIETNVVDMDSEFIWRMEFEHKNFKPYQLRPRK